MMRLATVLAVCGACSSHAHAVIDGPGGDDTPDANHDAAIDAPADAPNVDDPCFPSPQAGHSVYTCNGFKFDVEVPAACPEAGCGLIFDSHGLTMSAAMQDANDELRMRGGAAGFVVIQPNANPAPPQASFDPKDDPKLYDFLSRALAVYHIDPHRVHMTGFSQGGFMTWRFLCAHADVFASVAPGAAASNCTVLQIPACKFTGTEIPSRQLPVLYMHGTKDADYVPYSCAQPQIDAVVAAWGLTSDGVIASSPTYRRTRWSNAQGGLLEFLSHDYFSDKKVLLDQTKLLGHCFPGSTDPGGMPGQLFSFKCEQPADFTWGVELVAFFVSHPKP